MFGSDCAALAPMFVGKDWEDLPMLFWFKLFTIDNDVPKLLLYLLSIGCMPVTLDVAECIR